MQASNQPHIARVFLKAKNKNKELKSKIQSLNGGMGDIAQEREGVLEMATNLFWTRLGRLQDGQDDGDLG